MADGTESDHSIGSLLFPFQSRTISHWLFAIGFLNEQPLPRSGFSSSLCLRCCMPPPERTVRQRIIELLIGTRLSSYQLAQLVGIAERLIEEHLPHVVKTLARDRTQRFVLEPAACSDCGFVFRDRTKLTRPSRCPTCRSEGITAPRYGIEPVRK
jgi:predicted Zn-ribbon and HTH transcriptional regulator